MKIIQFTIPVAKDKSIHVQEDDLPHFYEHLHRHHEIQITWVISGEGTLVAGNNMQPFSSGDIFIIGGQLPIVQIVAYGTVNRSGGDIGTTVGIAVNRLNA